MEIYKLLLLTVDSSVALKHHWPTFLSNFLLFHQPKLQHSRIEVM